MHLVDNMSQGYHDSLVFFLFKFMCDSCIIIQKEGEKMNWEQYAAKVLSVSKIGLKYSKDPYAIENYEALEILSKEMLNELPGVSIHKNLYERDIYPTPNISVRVLVTNEKNQLLMVKENVEGKWAVPGGWCDVFETVSENAIKEVKQESGYDVKLNRLLGVFQRERYKDYPTLVSEVVHYFSASVIGGGPLHNHETSEVQWFDFHQLPELSKKTTSKEIQRALHVLIHQLDVEFD